MFLSYAVDRNKQWLHISDVAAGGRTTDLFCPFCGRPIIAKKGRALIHHFAHEANQSCREWASLAHYVAPEEGYYGADLSPAQQRMLREILANHEAVPFAAERLTRSTLAALAAKRFVNLFDVPDPYYSTQNRRLTTVAQLTARAKAFAHQLTLAQYAQFAETEYQRMLSAVSQQAESSMALTLLQVEYQRWQDTHLYLLEITTEERPLLKIGVTARPLSQRMEEIRIFLRRHYRNVDIQPRFYLARTPYLEGYFKSKFAIHQFPIASATEYFHPFIQAYDELEELAQLVAAGMPPAFLALPPDAQRPRFRAIFWREHTQSSEFHLGSDKYALLLDVVNLHTGERFAEWQLLAFGKQFAALGPLHPGDGVEFTAAVVGDVLKRPTKLVKLA